LNFSLHKGDRSSSNPGCLRPERRTNLRAKRGLCGNHPATRVGCLAGLSSHRLGDGRDRCGALWSASPVCRVRELDSVQLTLFLEMAWALQQVSPALISTSHTLTPS